MPTLKGDWLALVAESAVRYSANPKPHDIVARALEEYGVIVTYKQAHTALTRVLGSGLQSGARSYGAIVPWLIEITTANPGSRYDTVVCEGRLQRVFLALQQWIAAAQSCIPVVSLDACHLKGVVGGTLFCATMLSRNHDIAMIALGISPVEDGASWAWFIANLQASTDLFEREDIVIMSDREKGLANAVSEVLPGVPHGFCSQHIKENVKTAFKTDLGGRIHEMSVSVEKNAVKKLMDERKVIDPGAAEYLTKIGDAMWMAFAFPRPRFGQVTSNRSESSNSWILPERAQTWLECMTSVVRKIQERTFKKRKEYGSLEDGCVPWVSARVIKAIEGARRRLVCPVTNDVYEVLRESDRTYAVVDIAKRECTCRLWREQQYPCYHTCAAILFRKESPLQYVSHYYSISSLKLVFASSATPVDLSKVVLDETRPPVIEKKRGRPKKIRLRSRSEYLNNDSPVHCGGCGKAGHNVRTCARRQKQKLARK